MSIYQVVIHILTQTIYVNNCKMKVKTTLNYVTSKNKQRTVNSILCSSNEIAYYDLSMEERL